MWLSEQDRDYLNAFYAQAYQRHFAFSSNIGMVPQLTYAEAVNTARDELEEYFKVRRTEITERTNNRIMQINTDYDTRIIGINNDANARGLIGSTIVLHQLENARKERQLNIDRAQFDRDIALARFENLTENRIRAHARRKMSDNTALLRLGMQSDINTLDMHHKTRGTITNTERQRNLDEDVFAEYKRWLLTKSPEVALALVDGDPLFYFNLSLQYYSRLVHEMERRAVRR